MASSYSPSAKKETIQAEAGELKPIERKSGTGQSGTHWGRVEQARRMAWMPAGNGTTQRTIVFFKDRIAQVHF